MGTPSKALALPNAGACRASLNVHFDATGRLEVQKLCVYFCECLPSPVTILTSSQRSTVALSFGFPDKWKEFRAGNFARATVLNFV
jgi:hypothetical protein